MEEKAKGIHDGHRERVKKKFLESGFTPATPEHEVLEMLLFYSIPRQDTNPLAHELLNRFGSLPNVLNASYEQLLTVKGISSHTAILLKLILAASDAYLRSMEKEELKNKSADDAGEYLLERYRFLGKDEIFSVLSLDGVNDIKSFDIIERGDIATVGVSLRKIIETLIRNKAHSVVLAHNHPSGIALPSQEDITITANIIKALMPLGIKVADHIIVSGNDYVSLAQSDRFKEMFE